MGNCLSNNHIYLTSLLMDYDGSSQLDKFNKKRLNLIVSNKNKIYYDKYSFFKATLNRRFYIPCDIIIEILKIYKEKNPKVFKIIYKESFYLSNPLEFYNETTAFILICAHHHKDKIKILEIFLDILYEIMTIEEINEYIKISIEDISKEKNSALYFCMFSELEFIKYIFERNLFDINSIIENYNKCITRSKMYNTVLFPEHNKIYIENYIELNSFLLK